MVDAHAALPEDTPEQVAAVDLGSNSFHMVVARPEHGRLHVVDRLRERVALAAGLDDRGRLTPEASERALACLDRFGQRLAEMPVASVRAVGTSALRRAKNSRKFLAAARARLGYEIDIIGGLEEARLIYLGVSQSHGELPNRRLVIDVGGGSTEVILGEGFAPQVYDSFNMGCVGFSQSFFPDGEITREAMRRARLQVDVELQGVAKRYQKLGWEGCIGSSGTVLAVQAILTANGWTESDAISAKGLRSLRRELIAQGRVEALDLPGLQRDRAPVIAGGVAILSGLFDSLGIDEMQTSTGALREGVLFDLLGRIRHEDVRDTTIRGLFERYHVDTAHAARVLATAGVLFEAVEQAWSLSARGRQALDWAAQLFEVGLSIAYSGYHRHGAYILAHANLPGFSRSDQELLSALVLGHRRKPRPAAFEELQDPVEARSLCTLLRLAVLLHRDRSSEAVPEFEAHARPGGLKLQFPDGWLESHPLTSANLAEEARRLELFELSLDYA